MTSCSSGSMYEGDTCSFTCNAGFELTGNDTRTCQSDGSWSGTETMCRRGLHTQYAMHTMSVSYFFLLIVPCPPLTDPNNGVMTCLLRDDGVPFYEDICSFTCNTGFELTGSDTRTCQSDGSWSGSETLCRRGKS